MKYMTGNEAYLQFFKSKEHLILHSFPLIPENDPSLLLIGAGMAPLKPYFTGKLVPPSYRVTTSQKCIRTDDIDNVGRTARHHTFFEMLGNFSFGNYFKKEAISWAWEFLTKVLELDTDKLYVTIYPDDKEAYDYWHNMIGLADERIFKFDDNFWEIGEGPCGPDSEIFYDLGPERGCGKPTCAVGCDCDRYLEIWNLVFTQYNRTKDGKYEPLAKKNIDTGCGLERLASVIQQKESNFETDLIFPIIEKVIAISGGDYSDPRQKMAMKVIADHIRAITFMISDGILPSAATSCAVSCAVLSASAVSWVFRTSSWQASSIRSWTSSATNIRKRGNTKPSSNRSSIPKKNSSVLPWHRAWNCSMI